jgi:transposase
MEKRIPINYRPVWRYTKLADRQEYLKKVAGVSVSESTLSRALRKMGFGRKKDAGCE